MKSVNLYTEQLFFLPRTKNFLKNVFRFSLGGPKTVQDNLVLGLKQLNYQVQLDKKLEEPIPVAGVLSGVKTLQWAIEQKLRGKINKLVAGPNIGMPNEANGLMFHPAIDKFLVPAPWVKNFCASFNAEFAPKLEVWAAGVATLSESEIAKTARGNCLVYQKNSNFELLEKVKQSLQENNIQPIILIYGKYSPEEYLETLKKADFAIFLTDSESQGLAIHESWMANVPTLVWNGGHMKFGGYEWRQSSPAPYLNEQCGMLFSSLSELPQVLKEFLARLPKFTPRLYHLNNFTPEITAQKYLELLKFV